MPKRAVQPPPETINVWDAEDVEEFEIFPDEMEAAMSVMGPEGHQTEVSHLEARVSSMEHALTQIVQLLESRQPSSEVQ